jgi:hypothetical protein
MRRPTGKFRALSMRGRVLFGLGCGALLVLTLMTLMFGSLGTTVLAVLLVVLYVVSAPFVIAGHWRASTPPPTRRPVVRKRRY